MWRGWTYHIFAKLCLKDQMGMERILQALTGVFHERSQERYLRIMSLLYHDNEKHLQVFQDNPKYDPKYNKDFLFLMKRTPGLHYTRICLHQTLILDMEFNLDIEKDPLKGVMTNIFKYGRYYGNDIFSNYTLDTFRTTQLDL